MEAGFLFGVQTCAIIAPYARMQLLEEWELGFGFGFARSCMIASTCEGLVAWLAWSRWMWWRNWRRVKLVPLTDVPLCGICDEVPSPQCLAIPHRPVPHPRLGERLPCRPIIAGQGCTFGAPIAHPRPMGSCWRKGSGRKKWGRRQQWKGTMIEEIKQKKKRI